MSRILMLFGALITNMTIVLLKKIFLTLKMSFLHTINHKIIKFAYKVVQNALAQQKVLTPFGGSVAGETLFTRAQGRRWFFYFGRVEACFVIFFCPKIRDSIYIIASRARARRRINLKSGSRIGKCYDQLCFKYGFDSLRTNRDN